MEKSKPYSLNQLDYQKILKDALLFSLVPASFYIVSVLGTIQTPNHILSLKDFIPTNGTLIAIVAWVLNQALNLIRKYIV